MDLQFDTEHTILGDSAERMLAENYDFAARHADTAGGPAWADDIWRQFAEMGWLAMPFSEEDGGLGAGMVEISILMEAFGRHLVVEPYLSTVVLCGGLVAAIGTPEQRADILPAIGEGSLRFAYMGGAAGSEAEVEAAQNGDGYVLTGSRKSVIDAPMADRLVVPAKLGGGTGVYVVECAAPGVTIRPHRTVQNGYAADVELAGAQVAASALLGDQEDASEAIDCALDHAIAALSADAVGAIKRLVEETIEYTKTREQFGRPLSKFQVLQHRMVDMKVAEEEARAVTLLAVLSVDADAGARRRAVSSAKSKVGRCARFVGQSAIQTHGAIGTTQELSVGNYVKRLMVFETLFGSTAHHTERYAAIIDDPEIAGASLLLSPS
ncbi:MAG: acyl-CoA dehydrogenase [Rhodospirillales bacterium]|nr:acyl-CoA dehydrogenase [Rhodospirillales bacterium]MDP6646583.1 acyl-CoA dehydrogenase [Rhodospirillales bacterium]MDP6842998.1 acyl-CoA dehydrogenase [Rhodospirillales bacterium]